MPVIEGARHRVGASAGVSGDTTGYGPFISAAAPTTAFNGIAEKGALCIATTAGVLYINTGTKAANTWTVVGTQT